MKTLPTLLGLLVLSACTENAVDRERVKRNCNLELVVLGIGQDAGVPQIGNSNDPAWSGKADRLLPTSLAVIDHEASKRVLFEATPAITEQVHTLDSISKKGDGLGLDGIFLTHAHIGHYAGLMYLGREAAGARDIPVYTMPRFADFLRTNGPWDQLVSLNNITLTEMSDQTPVSPVPSIKVTPYQVPHRDEYSETVGYLIETKGQNVFFLPDIDSWDEWEQDFGTKIDDIIEQVDYAYLDATFFDDNELPGRDMSAIPHPRVSASMERFDNLLDDTKAGIHFIHINHTNPIRFEDSEESKTVIARGFSIAREGQRICLSEG